jgi:Zn-dependent protease
MVEPAPVAKLFSAEDTDFEATMKWLVSPPPMQQPKTRLLIFSLIAFVAASWVSGSGTNVVEIATLVGVILFHELGHMVAMKIVGYRDVRIFFIPFFGGAASGTKRGVARWKEAIVLLCGPLPGIVAGTVLAFAGDGELMRVVALQLIIINALNLLPISPLDGGQLFSVLLFSRQRHLELFFVGATAAIVVIGGIYAKLWVLAIVGFFIVVSLAHKKRILDVAHQLRDRGLPSDPAALDESQQRELYTAAMDSLPGEWRTRWAGKVQPKAQLIEQILERATQRAPSVGATAGLLGIWAVSFAIAVVGLFLALGPSWRPYTSAEGRFAVELPGAPVVGDQAGFHAVSTRVGRSREYSVMWNDVADPDGWITAVHDGLAAKTKLTELTTTPTDRTFTYREGGQVLVMRLTSTPQGRVYMIGAAAPEDEPDSHRFVTSFRIEDPARASAP